MRTRIILFICCVLFAGACKQAPPASTAPSKNQKAATPQGSDTPSPLPDKAFKAQLTLIDVPQKMRGGEKQIIHVRIKNNSDVMWWARGARINTSPNNKFYIAAGNRWLNGDGSLLTNMDGRYGIPK